MREGICYACNVLLSKADVVDLVVGNMSNKLLELDKSVVDLENNGGDKFQLYLLGIQIEKLRSLRDKYSKQVKRYYRQANRCGCDR